MINIDPGSFIFGFFCCGCLVIAYIFGKLAMGDGTCGKCEDEEYESHDEYYSEEVSEE